MTRSNDPPPPQILRSDEWNTFDAAGTPQQRGIAAPPLDKPASRTCRSFDLVPPEHFTSGETR